MARGMKTRGVEEISQARSRAIRQHAMGRLSRENSEWIVAHLDEVVAYIIKMTERGDEV